MSSCEETKSSGKPSCKTQPRVDGSCETADHSPDLSIQVGERKNLNKAALTASVANLGEGLDIFNVVSSGDESEQRNSRKRRLSKPSIEILVEPSSTVPLPSVDENISPDEFLLKLVDAQLGCKLEPKKAKQIKDFFHESTDAEVAAYTTEVVAAVRDEDLDRVRSMQEGGQELNCFNRFGESLLNLACRRGFKVIVRYLMDQPSVTVKSTDDCGRTPLHDACWHPQPQLEICQWIMEEEPALFFIMDQRGCTAFQYARPQHWPVWRKFLLENRKYLDGLKDPAIISMLKKTC